MKSCFIRCSNNVKFISEEEKETSASESGDKKSIKIESAEENKKKLDNGADNSIASGM